MDGKIIQILPADNWVAVYMNEKHSMEFNTDLVCFALVEDRSGIRYIIPMTHDGGKVACIDDVTEDGNFVRITKRA